MARNRCWVEVVGNKPVRILKHHWSPMVHGGTLAEWPRVDAIRDIRQQVYKRANSCCEKCGERLTWRQMHMDERVSRGEGGEVSVDNSWVLCYDCHLGPDGEHGDRRWGGRG